MFENCKNSKIKGTVGLGSAIEYFTRKNFIISLPLNDSQDYDLIVDDGTKLQKVQVRTSNAQTKHDTYCVNLRVLGGNATNKSLIRKTSKQMQYDLLYVLCGDGSKFLIPKEVFRNNVSCINVGKKSYSEWSIV